MRTRPMTVEHQQAAARRLAQLSTQLQAERDGAGAGARASTDVADPEPWGTWTETGWASHEGEPEAWQEEHTRVVPALAPGPGQSAAGPNDPWPPTGGAAAPGAVPMPGRHAARRAPAPGERAAVVTDLVPETLRGRIGFGATHVAVVAVLVAVGALAVAWFVVRGDPEAPTPVAVGRAVADTAPLAEGLDASSADQDGAVPVGTTGQSVPVRPAGAADGAPSDAGTSTVTVDVAGKVRRPGIVVLDAGSRVVDALEGAGGAKPGVDLVGLNLARLLVDGEQIVVGAPPGVAVPAPVTGAATSGGTTVPGATGAPGVLVDLNIATQPELEELPEVGPVTAAAIIAWREENGGFSAVTELLEVDGIGDKTLEQLTPLVTV